MRKFRSSSLMTGRSSTNNAPESSRPPWPLKLSRVSVVTGVNAPLGDVSVSLGNSLVSLGRSFWMWRPKAMKSFPAPAGAPHSQPSSSGRGCVAKRGSESQSPAAPPRTPRSLTMWMLPPIESSR
jgi:hypothetical protein